MKFLVWMGVSLVFAGIATYVYGWKERGILYFSICVITVFLSLVCLLYLMFELDVHEHPMLTHWMVPMSYGFIGVVATVAALIVPFSILAVIRYLVMRHANGVDSALGMERREAFKLLALGLPVATGLASTVATVEGANSLRFQPLTLRHPDMPVSLIGRKIAQISDFHLGVYSSLEDLERIFQRLQEEHVDQIWITGDLIDDVKQVHALGDVIRHWAVEFPGGIDYIYGNHEYFRDIKALEKEFETWPMRILRNESMPLTLGDESVYLVGVDYPFTKGALIEKIEAFLTRAMGDVPKGAFPILLAHHPDFIGAAFTRDIPLIFAGHSHGGQINIFHHSLVPLGYQYWRGFYAREDGRSIGYVSTGAGDWCPLRFNCPREVSIFTFEKGMDQNPHDVYPVGAAAFFG